jgi:hypothetical protein
MTVHEIKDAIARIGQVASALEEAYIDHGGEVTAGTEALEVDKASLQDLLSGEGIDALGRWLRSVEDEKKALQAEKDSIQRQIAAKDRTIDYIKGLVYQVMTATGQDKAKGTCYSFTPYLSHKVELDQEILKANYGDAVEKAIRAAGIPDYIGVSLTASSQKAAELAEGDEGLFRTVTAGSVRFVKPKADKEA